MASPLIDVAELAMGLADPALRIVDCRWYLADPERGRDEYAAAHLPGAVFLSIDTDLASPPGMGGGRHPLPPWDGFAATLGRLGIGNERLVVAYDDRGGAVAARLWWMLRAAGHDRIRVLDGGITAWKAAGLPVTADVPAWPEERFVVDPKPEMWLDREALQQRLGTVRLIDARAPERYRGETEPIDPVAGHIPTARNLPFTELLGTDERFLDPDVLRARVAAAVEGEGPTIVYCGSGVNACHVILGLELAGHTDVVLYPGSWSDWSTAGFEVATGGDPGEPTRS